MSPVPNPLSRHLIEMRRYVRDELKDQFNALADAENALSKKLLAMKPVPASGRDLSDDERRDAVKGVIEKELHDAIMRHDLETSSRLPNGGGPDDGD